MLKRNKSLMQSEIFIIIMIIIVMLYGITTIYAITLQEENKILTEQITDPDYIKRLEDENKKLKDENENLKDKIKKLNLKIQHFKDKIKKLEDENSELKDKIKNLKLKLKKLEEENEKLKNENQRLDEELKNNKKPPLITLSEDEKDFRFDSGKAAITDSYKSALMGKTLPELIKNINDYDCNTIEIYGFTDMTPYGKRNSNIDDKLHNCITHTCDIDNITINTNLELGMKRAISIVSYLKQQQDNGLIRKDIVIKPYSAGQFIDEKGNISTYKKSDNKKRRRIEIRISRDKRVDSNNKSK